MLQAFFGLIVSWVTAVALPVFDPIRPEADPIAARSASGIDLTAVGTNLWATAVTGTAAFLDVRAAIDKVQYRRGEPIHLFVYLRTKGDTSVALPKAEELLMLRVGVLDAAGNPLPLTPAGEWLDGLPAPEAMGKKWLDRDRVRMLHVDVTDVADLSRPGEYIVVPRAVFFSIPDPSVPKTAEFPGIRFRVTDEAFRPMGNPAKSLLRYRHEESLGDGTGAPRRMSGLEAELVAQSQAAQRAHDAVFEAAMKAAAESNSPPAQSHPQAGADTDMADPASPEAPSDGVEPVPPATPDDRRPITIVAGIMAALGVLWLRLRRSH